MDVLQGSTAIGPEAGLEPGKIQNENGITPAPSDHSSSNFDIASTDATADEMDCALTTEASLEDAMAEMDSSPLSASLDDLDEQQLLEMIQNGELEYSIEKDPDCDAEEADMEPIEFLCETSMPLPTPDPSTTSPSKKRAATDGELLAMDHHMDKKPKLSESELSPPSASLVALISEPTQHEPMDVDEKSSQQPVSPTTAPTAPDSNQTASPAPQQPPKSASRPRSHALANLAPLSMVTRTRALAAASKSGTEIVVPEHSHTLPKWMPRAPIRAIEIPTWTIRESYETEEAQRDEYKAKLRNLAVGPSGMTSSPLGLETQYLASIDTASTNNIGTSASIQGQTTTNQLSHHNLGPSRDSDDECEVVGDDEYYAAQHYRYEILERLRWVSGPGSDRFKQEDRNMTLDQFKQHELWLTYRNITPGKLLPEDLWAQNMVYVRPKSVKKDRSSRPRSSSNASRSPAKSSTAAHPIVIPKGFVLKIKSVTGETTLKTIPPSLAPTNARPALTPPVRPFGSYSSENMATRPQPTLNTPYRPLVKKSGLLPSNGAPSPYYPHHHAPLPSGSAKIPTTPPTSGTGVHIGRSNFSPVHPPSSAPTTPLNPTKTTLPIHPASAEGNATQKGPAKLIVKFGTKRYASAASPPNSHPLATTPPSSSPGTLQSTPPGPTSSTPLATPPTSSEKSPPAAPV